MQVLRTFSCQRNLSILTDVVEANLKISPDLGVPANFYMMITSFSSRSFILIFLLLVGLAIEGLLGEFSTTLIIILPSFFSIEQTVH